MIELMILMVRLPFALLRRIVVSAVVAFVVLVGWQLVPAAPRGVAEYLAIEPAAAFCRDAVDDVVAWFAEPRPVELDGGDVAPEPIASDGAALELDAPEPDASVAPEAHWRLQTFEALERTRLRLVALTRGGR